MRRFERKNVAPCAGHLRSGLAPSSFAVVRATVVAVGLAIGAMASGCAASGVGDPCTPEAVPRCGFARTEVYVETSSVQCRTRVCVVYRLDGHPENLQSEGCPHNTSRTDCATPTNPDTCVDDLIDPDPGVRFADESDERVFCSCRCRASAANPNLPLCTCEAGYHCADEDFCVPNDADPRFCDYIDHYNCPGRCDLTTQRCP